MLRRITFEELAKILEDHQHWINKDCSEWEKMRANLSEANLFGADLHRANLSGANLSGADLFRADLFGANLFRANLSEANLDRVVLSGANLFRANLSEANLDRVVLSGANLSGAYLSDAVFTDSIKPSLIPLVCPDTGSFVGWKKAYGEGEVDVLVCLEIPADAKRSSATGRKCRCDKAKVLGIYNTDGTLSELKEAYSIYGKDICSKNFIYRVGEIVSVDDFCENRWKECAPGIHFFINRQEAIDYNW